MIDDIVNNSEKLIFVIISSLMVFELILAFVFFTLTKKFIANSKLVKAKITKIETLAQGKTRAYITFNDYLGRIVETNIHVPAGKYKEEEEIELFSHKENPSKVKINSFLSLWILPLAFLQGFIIIGIGLAFLVSDGTAKLPF